MEGETDAINFINERTARGGGARGVGSVDSGYSAGLGRAVRESVASTEVRGEQH
jgi:hypothetical protein